MLSNTVFSFLKELAANNKREWFTLHKKNYDVSRSQVLALIKEVHSQLDVVDKIENSKIFRINRDVRFSSNKSPYKTNFSGYYTRLGDSRRGSYYMSIQPGNQTVVGGGFYDPSKEDLFRIRKEFELDESIITKITTDKTFKLYFDQLRGERVATAPRDFDKEHPHIKWIQMKQFYAFRSFTDEEVMDPTFPQEVMKTFMIIRPFFDYMSDILTTDLNGESILK
jgi:uncharacterized protein (TIGR02453 family)